MKANIALGGKNSINTFIVENNIQGGNLEGILLVNSEKCLILRNKIIENHNGIVCQKSSAII